MGVPRKLVLDNTTFSDYKFHIKTIDLAIKKIVEVTHCSTLSQSLITDVLPSDVQSIAKLCLNKTLGYTALMGVPPELQLTAMFVSCMYIQNIKLHCTHGCATYNTAYMYAC